MRSYKVIAAREREQVMLPESAKKMRKMLAEVGKTMLDKPKEV
jgi:hypothetical protein